MVVLGGLFIVFNYLKSAATARKLLANFGQDMTLTTEVRSQTTGALISTQELTDKGVIFPYSDGELSMSSGLIQANDQKIMINIATRPTVTDKITVGSIVYTIVNVKALEPAGVNVLYEIQVRA